MLPSAAPYAHPNPLPLPRRAYPIKAPPSPGARSAPPCAASPTGPTPLALCSASSRTTALCPFNTAARSAVRYPISPATPLQHLCVCLWLQDVAAVSPVSPRSFPLAGVLEPLNPRRDAKSIGDLAEFMRASNVAVQLKEHARRPRPR